LQRGDLPEKKQDAPPFRALPGDVRLDEKRIGHQRTKSAQRGDESELSNLFAETQVEIDRSQTEISMRLGDGVLRR
jgi:hypothetical protein